MQVIASENLINGLAMRLRATCRGHIDLWRELLCLLVQGEPVTPDQLARTMHMSRDEVIPVLRQIPKVEYNADGNIIGAALSLVPTKHHFFVNDVELFTWCAFDTLAYPLVLQRPVLVESRCPVSNELIRLHMTPTELDLLQPEGAYIALVLPDMAAMCENIRSSFCNHIHFLYSRDAAMQWQELHPDALPLPVRDAFPIAQAVARRVYHFDEGSDC